MNGKNPYLPGDQLGEIRLYYPGGSMVWTNHPIQAQPPASLSVSKSSSTILVTTAGQVVTYVYEIHNTGQTVLNDVGLSDDNVDAEPFCDFAGYDSLEVAPNPESSVICSATHTVTEDELELGEPLVNTATAFADEAESATARLSIPMGFFSDGFEGPENLITVLDRSNVTGLTSIATGSDGFAVVSYTDRDLSGVTGALKITKCHNTRCTYFSNSAVNAPGNVISTSIAVGDDGFPVISYIDYDPDTNTAVLKVANCNDPTCSGADGLPVFAYRDKDSGSLIVAKCNDAACSGNDELESAVGISYPTGTFLTLCGPGQGDVETL